MPAPAHVVAATHSAKRAEAFLLAKREEPPIASIFDARGDPAARKKQRRERVAVMSGRVHCVVPRLDYTFRPAISTTTTVVLGARGYSVPEGVSGAGIIRVSSATGIANATVTVNFVNVSISPDEPQTIFLGGNAGTTTIVNATNALLVAALSGMAAMIQVQLVIVTTGSFSGTIAITMGADLVIRDA